MKILASADNPGGANAVAPVVRRLLSRGDTVSAVLGGAGRAVFSSFGISFVDADSLSDADIADLVQANAFDLFVAGTSMGLTIDKKLLDACKKNNIPSVYILDSWVNYWQRFSRETKDFSFLPDYICVTDETNRAAMLAENFPAEKIIVTGNPYFDDFIDGIDSAIAEPGRILFISQPLPNKEEYPAVMDILTILKKLKFTGDFVIRLHPRDEPEKFNDYISSSSISVSYDDCSDIKKSLSRAGLVIGINSMVLFQAALAGKLVISYVSGESDADCLPSNAFGLSILVKNSDDLEKTLEKFLAGNMITSEHALGHPLIQDIAKRNATERVINFLDGLSF